MKNEKLKKIKSFADSDADSAAEDEFSSKELQAYFDKKLRHKYAARLNKEFDIKKENTKIGNSKKKPNFIKHYFLLALIGGLLVFAIYYFFNNRNKVENNVHIAYKSELYTPVDFNVRGTLSDPQKLLIKLNEAYVKKDFNTVISEYQKLKNADTPYDLNMEQMVGIAFASLGNYAKAINIFKGILSTKESTYSNHTTVRYLLGLTYLLNTDKPNAIETLQQIKEGDYKYDEAQAILEEL